MWKSEKFSATYILREIKRWQMIIKIADFYIFYSSKMISRKIWVAEKFLNFHTVILVLYNK